MTLYVIVDLDDYRLYFNGVLYVDKTFRLQIVTQA